jgi:dTDP-4-dehydrorhamnose reductase
VKILLLGADGQLGYELHRSCAPLGDILPYTFTGKLAGRQACGQVDFARKARSRRWCASTSRAWC